jgi:Transposase IS4/Dual oxidase maturation factor
MLYCTRYNMLCNAAFILTHTFMLYGRFEIYLGKKQHDNDIPAIDNKTGPAAVIRNMTKLLQGQPSAWRVVTIDRFYTGLPLLLHLLSMKMYAVGTIMINRLGYCKDVINKAKRRTTKDIRGSFKMARSVDVPSMIALSWMDNKPVHFLSTGPAGHASSVSRRMIGGVVETISAPDVVSDYHRLMGGVDRHDQLRLQRYSLQLHYRFQKYYKALFMGLIDLVIVNSYVTHCWCAKSLGVKALTRARFMSELHAQLIKQVGMDFDNSTTTPVQTNARRFNHTIKQNESFRTSGNQRMRRRNACKVCSITHRKKGGKSNETSWFCEECSEDNKRLFLCNSIRASQGNTKTCYDIWHDDWNCKVPATASSYIMMRPTTGVRKRKRNRIILPDRNTSDEDSDEEQ